MAPESELLPHQCDRILGVVDGPRLDYLCGVYRRVIPLVKRDLAQFRIFLERILP